MLGREALASKVLIAKIIVCQIFQVNLSEFLFFQWQTMVKNLANNHRKAAQYELTSSIFIMEQYR